MLFLTSSHTLVLDTPRKRAASEIVASSADNVHLHIRLDLSRYVQLCQVNYIQAES